MRCLFVIVITFYLALLHDKRKVFGTFLDAQDDPDVKRNVSQLIRSKGFPDEEHIVQTDDGYILSVQRIPHGRDGNTEKSKKGVILLPHGELADAGSWFLNFRNQSLGFVLADSGYDVWLINHRGCRYSRKHIQYSTNDYRFWNFSFDEMGRYDIPNTIDYILEVTGEDSLYVIGHSRGCASTFAALSSLPEYNRKVKLFIALAPAVFLAHMTSPVRTLAPTAEEIKLTVDALSHGELGLDNPVFDRVRGEFCFVSPELCELVLFAIGGVDEAQLNKTRIGVYASHFPSTSSTRSLVHLAQIINTNEYKKYDFGPEGNLEYYQQEKPPEYNLSSITTPVALFWSDNDKLVDPEDVDILRSKLNSVVFDHRIQYPYSHFDYIIAMNALEKLHKPILQCLSEH